jgi:hypothetical protein
MKTIIPFIIILCNLTVARAAGQSSQTVTNSVRDIIIETNNVNATDPLQRPDELLAQLIKTNGLYCDILISRHEYLGETKLVPLCIVSLVNTTTNFIRGCANLPIENLFKTALSDSQGKWVKTTKSGSMFGQTWSQKQIDEWWKTLSDQRISRRALFIYPKVDNEPMIQQVAYFNITDVFQIEQPGEYTLHLQMRLIRFEYDPHNQHHYSTTWLPEATAKVQIRAEDLPKTNSMPSGP